MGDSQYTMNGQLTWYELATEDADKCRHFYQSLLGWKLPVSDNTELDYTEIVAGDRSIGGILQMTDNWKLPNGQMLPAHWMNYISVDDVDDTADKARELGANICVEPVDVPKIGRFAIINDPTGATFTIIKFTKN